MSTSRDALLEAVEPDAEAAARLFKALGDPVRVKLVNLIRRTKGEEACFCDLAGQFDMPQSSLSHHVKILVNAGLLTRERRGTWSWYRINAEALDAMADLLAPGGPLREASVCCD
ncbi:ArsR/SmtB family transcription factor [Lentzea sp. NPDC059081]|uniref:ArsR/SmtB family transcription factor n=1 Tax=Lentzea sp. NPDC059081 TaxID=3346719 RepID=UPI003693C03E